MTMKRSLMLALTGMFLVAPRALAGSGEPAEVTAVSVLPGPGHAQVVIDVTGSVSVQDFTLRNPDRLVIDVLGAQLSANESMYDGENRGGIVNLRYAQFRPDVVRIVLELESLKDYQLQYEDGTVRITFGTDRSFAAWTSIAPRDYQVAANERVFTPEARLDATTGALQGSQQRMVDVSYDSASIAEVMAGFATLSGKSIILGKDVTGTVTAQVNGQPWDLAFQAILQSQGLSAVEDPPGIIRVDQKSNMLAQDSVQRALGPLETRVVRVNYSRATALVPVLAGVVVPERGSVVADTATNSLVITDIEGRMDDHLELIRQLDRETPQVSIQAKLIFVNRTDVENLGFKYDLGNATQFFNTVVTRQDPANPGSFYDPATTPVIVDLGGDAVAAVGNAEANIIGSALDILFSTAISNFSLTAFAEALEHHELADLQAEPLTSTADNTEAYVLVGEETPIRVLEAGAQQQGATVNVEYKQTGILLRVTPHVTNNRQILMKVAAENSAVAAGPSDIGFVFQTQKAESNILVDDGQTAVIGGLTITDVSSSQDGIPYLMDLPLVGPLFRYTTRRENRRDLLILVTPHIMDNPETASAGT